MPTKFQKVMDVFSAKFREVCVFIDDNSIVTKETKQNHTDEVREILETFDGAKLQLLVGKCETAKQEIEFFGFEITSQGILPVISKVQGITEKLRLTNLKELRSFLGAVNHINKFIPDLASMCLQRRSTELER